MRWLCRLSIALLLVVVCVASLQLISANDSLNADNNHGNPSETISEHQTERQRFKLPKLIDFETYKQSFHRVYGSILEESERKRLFLARKLRASLSWVKYKLNLVSYRYGINDFSDMSRHELDQMQNLGLNPRHVTKIGHKTGETKLAVSETSSNNPLDTLTNDQQIPESKTNEVLVSEVENNEGIMGAPISDSKRPEGEQDKEEEEEEEEAEAKKGPRWAALESAKYWLAVVNEQPKPLFVGQRFKEYQQPEAQKPLAGFVIKNLITPLTKVFSSDPLPDTDTQPKVDQLIFDLRGLTNCISTPARQYKCGSCYAFAITTMAEFVYCRQFGKLIEFSPQYLVDCGEPVKALGCQGASNGAILNFIQNYGMELSLMYPYEQRENECPYGDQTDPKTMGRIRFKMEYSTVLNEDQFADYLRFAPIFVSIIVPVDIYEYEAGVMDGSKESIKNGFHAVVIVGYGREGNQDYWLVKNSFGTRWGLEGYFKLLKRSTLIRPVLNDAWQGQGFILGKVEGEKVKITAYMNGDYNPKVLHTFMSSKRLF